jgi:hypothetical protein|tara:strand:- start:1867 stop:2193 length:327 start_codon:yes stop_codon:yes gene_type:complete
MGSLGGGSITLSLPAPDFTMMSFTVWESAVMSIGLARALPEIRTYSGQGTNDLATTLVFDVTPHGFHTQILSPTDAWFISPAVTAELEQFDQLEQQSPEALVAERSGT